jgi:DNA-binding XRE family transcriptional regulator
MKQDHDRRHGAVTTAATLVQMDPHAREDLITYLRGLNEAQQDGNQQEQEYLLTAILEVFDVAPAPDGATLDTWADEVRRSPAGAAAARELDEETERFFLAYQRCKARSGLTTIRAVASASGLSPTTVQAIEKQRVKPQFRTIKALAAAFGVRPQVLRGR